MNLKNKIGAENFRATFYGAYFSKPPFGVVPFARASGSRLAEAKPRDAITSVLFAKSQIWTALERNQNTVGDTPIGAPEKDIVISFGFISQSDDAIVTIVHVIPVAWC